MSDGLASLVYQLESDPFGGQVRLLDLRLREAIHEPYRFELDVLVEAPDADVTTLLGTNVVAQLERDPLVRRVAGLVCEVHEGAPTDRERMPRARLLVAPALALLGLRRNTRMFQSQTVPEILEAVLGDGLSAYGREARLELDGSYTAREYCLQYQESDLDFVHRLMEEEGIHYLFDHEGDVEVMVLRDDSTTAARVRTEPDGGIVELKLGEAVARDTEPVLQFLRYHRATTTSVVVRDHEWTRDALYVEGEARGEDERGIDREVYEHGIDRKLNIAEYDAGARRYQEEDGADQAARRLEAHAAGAMIVGGISRVVNMTPGASFELVGHPDPGFDGAYFVTRVVHESRPIGDEQQEDRYHNRFECIPLGTPFRPPHRTPRPTIEGIQTAVVTGPAGEEIHVDEYGRVKVQFHWDRENAADETSSCWLRVKQEWAGAGWGFWWVPRLGMEVVVHFIDGDPDRPLLTGAVYDGANAPPYALPDEKTKSTIKSNSSLGGGGFNELRFEDKAGAEQVFTHAQKDYNEVVENDHDTLVHANQTNEVDGDQTQTIHGNQEERVDGTQSMSVGGDRTVHVEGDFEETVDGTETRHTVGDVAESFAANETRSIGASITEDIGGNETRSIGAAQSETIGGGRTRTVTGDLTDTIAASLTEVVAGGISVTTPGSASVTAAGGWNVVAPAGITINAAGGVELVQAAGMTRIDYEWKSNDTTGATDTFLSLEFYATKAELVGGHYAAGSLRVAIGDGEERAISGSVMRVANAVADGTWSQKSGLWNRFRFAIKL